jgi:hypothetical protein
MQDYYMLAVEFSDNKGVKLFDLTHQSLQAVKKELEVLKNSAKSDDFITINHKKGTAHYVYSDIKQVSYITAPYYA